MPKPETYLSLDPAIAATIEHDREAGWTNPYKTPDSASLRREDNPHDEATLIRPAFSRDIDKIINLPAYNRYADKTQVFSFIDNDDVSRRILHVQLVSRIARTIGAALGLNTDLIEAIALGHDIGHTPFGHAGERFLSKVYHEHTGRYFNHNVHSVRVMDRLFPRNISLQVLDGALCHNGEFAQQKLVLGETHDFETLDNLVEACNVDEQTIATLRPSTLEGCVVRVSDMIAYLGKDRDDALRMHSFSDLSQFESSIIGTSNAPIIHNVTTDIVNTSYGQDFIAMSQDVFEDLKLAKKQNYDLIYLKEGIIDDTKNIVEDMFASMYERALQDLASGNDNTPIYRHHVNYIATMSESWSAEAYLAEDPDQIVVDYIASMTDSYFLALYDYLFPGASKTLPMKDYFRTLES